MATQNNPNLRKLDGQRLSVAATGNFTRFLAIANPFAAALWLDQIRRNGNFKQKTNFGFLLAYAQNWRTTYRMKAFSGFPAKRHTNANATFKTTAHAGPSRPHCTEFQFINELQTTLAQKQPSVVDIYTERFPCSSCTGIMLAYQRRHQHTRMTVRYATCYDEANAAALRERGIRVVEITWPPRR